MPSVSSVVKSVRWHLVTKVPSHMRFLLASTFHVCDPIHVGRPTAVFRCPLIAVGLLYLENLWRFVSVNVSRKMALTAIRQHFMATIAVYSTAMFAGIP